MIPPNMPKPRGNSVSSHFFGYANHTGNKVTHCSQTGLLIFVNKAPIVAFSKRQNTLETSTFGSKFTRASQISTVQATHVWGPHLRAHKFNL